MRTLNVLLAAVGLAAVTTAATAQSSGARPPGAARSAADTAKAGKYDIEVTTDEGTLVGALTIKPGSKPGAELRVGEHAPATQSFVREGPGYVLKAGHEDFQVTYRLTFVRDSVTGTFSASTGMAGKIAGVIKR